MKPAQINIRIQRWVVFFSFALLAVKLVAYFITHSVSVLTDALEGIVNVVAGLLGLYSLVLSAKPQDKDHPYGHGKIEFLSAAVEGSLIAIAGILILIESVKNLIDPEALNQLDTGMVLISVAALGNFIIGTLCVNTGKKHNSLALVASGKHLLSDTYSTIGILMGLLLMYLTELYWIDSVVAILFSLFILYTGYTIIRSSVAGIMDETDEELLANVVKTLNENRNENWIDLHNLRIIKYGSRLHLDGHLSVPWYMNVLEAHQEIDALAHLVEKNFGDSFELFVHSDACKDFSCPICIKKDCVHRIHPFEKRIDWTVENIIRNDRHRISS